MSNADLSWDDLCVNPHQEFYQDGEQQGRKEGLEAGYRDGYATGRTTAAEYGIELGFIRGIVNQLLQQQLPDLYLENRYNSNTTSSSNTSKEKVNKTLHDLKQLVDKFPSPDKVLASEESLLQDNKTCQNQSESSELANNNVDLRTEIQVIRARFKLLTIQLGVPNLSLKHVMDDASTLYANDVTKPDGINSIKEQDW